MWGSIIARFSKAKTAEKQLIYIVYTICILHITNYKDHTRAVAMYNVHCTILHHSFTLYMYIKCNAGADVKCRYTMQYAVCIFTFADQNIT